MEAILGQILTYDKIQKTKLEFFFEFYFFDYMSQVVLFPTTETLNKNKFCQELWKINGI